MDQNHKHLLWPSPNFHLAYVPKHFEGWADISTWVQWRFPLSFKHNLLLIRGSPTLGLDNIHPSCLWYVSYSPRLLYRASVLSLDAKDPTAAQSTYSSKHFSAKIFLVNLTPATSDVPIFFCRITLLNGAQVQAITGCYLLQSSCRCCRMRLNVWLTTVHLAKRDPPDCYSKAHATS